MTRPSIFRNPRLNTSDKASIRKIDNTPRVYTLSPSTGFFQSGILDSSRPVYTSLDTATDDYGHPIAISAFRFQYDNNGNAYIIDSYRRYYEAHNWDMRSTQEHHNFTSRALRSLREQQHATYSKQYDAGEIASLQKYLGKSVIVGYGVHQFDFNNLFPYTPLPNSTIDLRAAARNIWPDKNSKLKNVFPRVLGNTMEQKGLLPSNPDASSLANIMLLDKMHRYPGEAGEAIRYVMNTPEGRQLVEKDPYLKNSTMVVKGTYKAQFDRHRLSEVYMTEEELKAAREEMAGYLNNIESNGGVGEETIPSTKYEVEDGDISPAVLEALAWMKTQQKHQGQESLKKKVKVKVKTGQSSSWLNNSTAGQELFQEFNQFNNYRRLGLVRQLASMGELEGDALLEAAGYTTKAEGYTTLIGMAAKLRKAKKDQELKDFRETVEQGNWKSLARDLSSGEYSEKYGGWTTGVKKYTPWTDKESPYTGSDFDRDAALKKMRYLNRAERSGFVGKDDRAKLDALVGSYDDLVDATDEVIEANQKLLKVYEAFAKIKPYDVNQYIQAAKGQWSGIMGASRGVVPSFIRNPISRLGDATFNAIDRSVSPWNALNRTWNSGIGNALTGALTAGLGPMGLGIGMAATGVVNAGTQIFGNYQQSKLEVAGLSMQNNLNTLGAMISWISTPFQLLHKALKLAIGSLSGFSLKLNSIMGSGINLMSQMGNPLEQMTGVDYLKYQGTTLMDIASLQSKGSTNSAIESFATMQRNLYRFGQIDTSKLLAANMLGVFNEAFSPTTDTVGAYYAMGNKILNNMQGQTASQQADTLYYVNQLNSSLAQTLRSAILMGVTDLHQLTDPSAFHQMYWRPISDAEEGQFRKTQYEYGVATQQFGYSKMRFADRLWNVIGRDIYNGLNELVDKAAVGDWKGVLESAGDMWVEFKAKIKEVWSGKDGEGGIGDKITAGLNTAWENIKKWGLRVANGIIDIWDQIFLAVLNKAQGLIAYLSTVQVDFVKDEKTGKWGIDISTIGSAADLDLSKPINTSTGAVYKGMEYLDQLASQYIPYYDENKQGYRIYTGQDLVNALTSGVIKDGVLDTPEINIEDYGLTGYRTHTADEAYDLLNMLYKGESRGTGFRRQAAAWLAPEGLRSAMDERAYHLPITDMAERLINSEQEIRYEISNHLADVNKDDKITVEFKGLGDQPVSATRENGKWKLTGMNPLQSIKLGNGVARAAVQVQ